MRRIVSPNSLSLRKLGRIAAISASLGLFASVALVAQTSQSNAASLVTTRLIQPINESARVTLHGTVHPLANAANDRGAAPDGMQLERMHLVLKRNSGQESALKQLVSDMHTSGTASYHKWLTPEQFGQQFGPSDQDISTVETWLQSKGFSVTSVNPGKQTLEFSGNAAQFRTAFHAQIHKYLVNGETHYANSTDPQIPAALAPVVGGFVSLNNFRARNFSHVLGKASYTPKTGKAIPEWTESGGPLGFNLVLSPVDFGIQYDLPNPALNPGFTGAPIDGTGQTIAIVNDSNINVAFANQFRTLFNLPANPPQVIIDGNDPGIDGTNNPDGPNFDSGEAYLDVEWSGAVAPGATIDLVIGGDTALEIGLILAAEHAVYSNVAPVMSMSFGLGCEVQLGSENHFLNSLWQQAAAQGITVMVSTGDAAAAGCDNDNTQAYAVNGVGVSGLSSTPYNVAVGGTDFYYSSFNQSSAAVNSQLATYWNIAPTNSPTANGSILTVIPEQPWNDSQYGLNIFPSSGATLIVGGSGGASSAAICSAGYDPTSGACTGPLSGYPKPVWQAGFGNDTVRDLPDVSLFASNGANNTFYPTCENDGDCQTPVSGQPTQITGIGGTSASSPSFAGIMALVNEKHGRQGQADFVLYPLEKQFPQAFHDVANGNNSVPCNISATSGGTNAPVGPSPDCIAVSNPQTGQDNVNGTATEGQTGNTTSKTPDYNATAGYDLASGLGTIDANQLVTNWGNVKFATTATTLTSSSTSFMHGTPVTLSGSVTGPSGTPTGSVALETDSASPVQQSPVNFPLSNGSFNSGSVNYLPGGTYNIWGNYSGDSTNGSSASAKTEITVNPESSSIFFNVISPTGTISSGASFDYGTQLQLSAQPVPSSQLSAVQACKTQNTTCPPFGTPSGTVAFTDGSAALNTAVVNAEGDAEYNAPFGVGSHSVTANYSGDASYNKSTASAISFTVVKDTPQIAVGASNTTSNGQIIAGQATVFNILVQNNAQISSVNSNTGQVFPVPVAPPTGTITVSGFPSGVPTSGTLSAAVDPNTRAVESVATITAPANTPTGNYNVTISYAGDGNYNSVTGNGTIQIVSTSGLSTTTTATASASSTSPTAAITVTGTVTGQSGHAAPTGGIIVYSSGTNVGEVGLTASGSNATFAFTLNSQSLFQGANFVTLQYTGDSTYAPSATTLNNGNAVSNPLSDFSMVPQTTLVPVTIGSSATDTINLSSVNGFAGAVNFTCAAAAGVTCSVNPGSFSLGASTGSVPVSTSRLTLFLSGGSAALACILFFSVPSRRRSWRAMLGMVILVCFIGIGVGCGNSMNSSSGGGTTPPPPPPPPPPPATVPSTGSITLTVTSTGSTAAGSYNLLVTGTANSGTLIHTLAVTAVAQ